MTTLSTTDLERFFSGQYFHPDYLETVEMEEEIRVHADGECPGDLISKRRPNEPEEVLEYRTGIYEAKTKSTFNKAVSTLNKVRRSADWGIVYDRSKVPARIASEEVPEKYYEVYFPLHGSITNFAFDLLLPEYGIDANAWLVIMPFDSEQKPNEYVRPYPFIFNSHQVIEVKAGDYGVFLDDEKCVYVEKGVEKFGDRYIIVTAQYIQKWEQISDKRQFTKAYEYFLPVERFPAYKMKSIIKKSKSGNHINVSRFEPMVPELNEAAREYSDLQAEIVQHMYSEKWELVTGECKTCRGEGKVRPPGHGRREEVCPVCNGAKVEPRGPYSKMSISLKDLEDAEIGNFPTPPAGYIQKSVEIVKVQRESIENHLFEALAAINLEYLADSPLNQSGVAKSYDRDEARNFHHSCAEDVVAMMDAIVSISNDIRYGLVVPNPKERADLLPTIPVPENYDIFSALQAEDTLVKLKEKGVSPIIVNNLTIEYAGKKFANNPEIRDRLTLSIKLDPLAGVSEDDKMVRLSNDGITKENYIISCNVESFIDRAIEEKGDAFFTMKLQEQRKLMKQYATEQISETSIAGQVLGGFAEGGVVPAGGVIP